ncbi:MAG: signal recognition particle-docking protein FtsY [Deltaproteobacteria bacterium HGW-Deltaproteobacteria-14]|nr:MAG: signal recognition particle-docking protein FtsY [Deltaproteobacteria bacterium HGW-Deltaproteobacteria-14]
MGDQGNNLAIIIAIAAAAAVLVALLIVLARRRKGKAAPPETSRGPAVVSEERSRVPASKEVFAPIPPTPAAGGDDLPDELREGDDDDALPFELREGDDDDDAIAAAPAVVEDKARETAPAAADAAKQQAAADAAKQQAAADAAKQQAAADAAKKQAATKAAADAKQQAEADSVARAEAEEDEGAPKSLRDGLGRTRKEGFIARLGGLFAGKAIDQDLIDAIEEVLFTADIGVRTADRLLDSVRESLSKKELKNEAKVWSVLHDEASRILADAAANASASTPKPGEPYVTMVLGVNGSGKTTSIGKLAHQLVGQGNKVTLIAGDTFRAAAAEQLEHWGRRVNAEVFRGKEGADPASVVFDGVRGSVERGADHVLVDTAGRLHTQVNLMEELKKVRRVMGNAIPGAPHRVLMVLDATTGQNAINQAKLFKEATDVTGIILTKLDGTAKGGVVLGVCAELGIPIDYIGIGERVADLRGFDSSEFVDELFRPPTA